MRMAVASYSGWILVLGGIMQNCDTRLFALLEMYLCWCGGASPFVLFGR